MVRLRFDENGKFEPQKVKFVIKHNEFDAEIIDNDIEKECDFEIKDYNKGMAILKEKTKIKN